MCQVCVYKYIQNDEYISDMYIINSITKTEICESRKKCERNKASVGVLVFLGFSNFRGGGKKIHSSIKIIENHINIS